MKRCPICGHSRTAISARYWTALAVALLLFLLFGTSALDGIWAAAR